MADCVCPQPSRPNRICLLQRRGTTRIEAALCHAEGESEGEGEQAQHPRDDVPDVRRLARRKLRLSGGQAAAYVVRDKEAEEYRRRKHQNAELRNGDEALHRERPFVRGMSRSMVQIGGEVVPPEPVGSGFHDEEQLREKGYASIGCPDSPESSRDGERRVG